MALKEVAAVAAVTVALCAAPSAWALSLGRLTVQSALGEAMRAEIDVTSLTPDEAANLRVRIAPPDAYRIAGVDYNPVLPATSVSVQRRADGTAFLRISSDRVVQEPFVDVILELSWSNGRLLREYTLLFDPPTAAKSAPAAPATPAATAPVSVAPPTPTAPAPVPTPVPVTAAPAPVPVQPEPAQPTAPMPATAPKPAKAPTVVENEYRVKQGDTLSGIAGRHVGGGVSLEQMLVGLFRGNSHAFSGSNMNRLKSGVVLSVPSSEQAAAIDAREAKRVIQAQSADFNAYRQRLAGAVPAQTHEAEPARKSAGKVQAEVQDRKAAAAPTPDRLQLDKGKAASSAGGLGVEDKIAKERAQKDAANRVGELARNLEELKKLQAASAATSAASSARSTVAAPVVAAASAKPSLLPGITAPAASTIAAAAPSASAAKPAASSVAAPAASAAQPIAVAASSAAPMASAAFAAASAASGVMPSVSPAASAMAAASEPVRAASKPAAAPPPPAPVEEPSLIDSLLENPMLLPGAGLLLALLAGFGFYKFRNRNKEEAGVTSFLESRLQPDSFFGASGGQRIDTRDASGAPSSMSYSLSQIDAIGDVDPVAEADVYLAYGRDLQAEEILKEAMRTNPERLAIRTKLLEVYAKRRDTKGYELLAGELYGLTGGQGEDWLRAQELGRTIDPENPLYEPGGAPGSGSVAEAGGGEMLGASTMPQSVVPSPSRFENSVPDLNLDDDLTPANTSAVDLDISVPAEMDEAPTARMSGFHHSAPSAFEASLPPSGGQTAAPSRSLEFDLHDVPSPASMPGQPPRMDLGDISLDLDAPAPTVAAEPLDMGASLEMGLDDDDADPLARKIELAEEFHQIGDHEGARDLLQEVIEKADGALKAKAQAMLNNLN